MYKNIQWVHLHHLTTINLIYSFLIVPLVCPIPVSGTHPCLQKINHQPSNLSQSVIYKHINKSYKNNINIHLVILVFVFVCTGDQDIEAAFKVYSNFLFCHHMVGYLGLYPLNRRREHHDDESRHMRVWLQSGQERVSVTRNCHVSCVSSVRMSPLSSVS